MKREKYLLNIYIRIWIVYPQIVSDDEEWFEKIAQEQKTKKQTDIQTEYLVENNSLAGEETEPTIVIKILNLKNFSNCLNIYCLKLFAVS